MFFEHTYLYLIGPFENKERPSMTNLSTDILYNGKVPNFKAKHSISDVLPWHCHPRVIGVIGSKRCGKDTFALALIEEGAKRNIEIRRVAFADALYREVAEAFGVTVEFLRRDDIKDTPVPELSLANCKDADFVKIAQNLLQQPEYASARLTFDMLSPRFCLQKWGTDYRRMTNRDDYWRKQVLDIIAAAPVHIRFIITDVRFSDEADSLCQEFEAVTVRVTRAKVDQEMARLRALKDPTACHPSETGLLLYETHYICDNVEGDFNAVRNGALQFIPS